MSNDPNELPSIQPAVLDEVTGGVTDDGKILEALKGIQDSINNLGKNDNNNSWQQMLPFLLMAFGGGSGSFTIGGGSGCACGCGGRGCCRRR
jgi:hypothetical protein